MEGNVYEGEYQDLEKSGEGTMTYKNGDAYCGQWKNDKRHGYGVYKFAKLDQVAEGTYENNKEIGIHFFTSNDGTMRQKLFPEGKWIDEPRETFAFVEKGKKKSKCKN